MMSNYFRILFRNLTRNKTFSIINILGLSIGIAACIIIYLYVAHELSYDKYHKKGDRIYRLISYYPSSGEHHVIKPAVLYDHINGQIPGVEKMIRIFRRSGTVSYGDKKFNEDNLKFSDPGIFYMFSWNFIAGDPETALNDKHALVLTKSMARKYFGDTDPLGKVMKLDNDVRFIVTGVMEDVPENSHFNFDCMGHSAIFERLNPSALEQWGNSSVFYYLLLKPKADVGSAEKNIEELFRKAHPAGNKISIQSRLQALHDVHLYSSDYKWEINPHGDISNVYGFSLIAFLVLLIACANFTNLTTASATSRMREVGIRKLVGANRNKLIFQFIAETFLYTLLALIIAIVITELFMPYFNELSGKELTFSFTRYPELYFILPLLLIGVSLLAGIYPAFVLSGFRPAVILKGSGLSEIFRLMGKRRSQIRMRQVLIVFQFTISIGLIIGAFIINRQMDYVRKKSLGFNREAVVVIENPWDSLMFKRYKNLRNELASHTLIKDISATHNIPGRQLNNYTGGFREVNEPEDNGRSVGIVSVDTGFFRMMEAAIVSGTSFAGSPSVQPGDACMINEELAKTLEFENPLGREMTGFYDGQPRRIVGVVKNIHYTSLHEKVKPVVYVVSPMQYPPFSNVIVVKIKDGEAGEAVATIEESWSKIAPDWPLEFFFLDQHLDELYKADRQVMKVVNVFTLLAIVISLMGLFGLTLFVMRSRTKEIGIRQVHGATMKNLMRMFSGEFALLLAIANLVAWPVAYWLLLNWIERFAFRIGIGIFPFLLAGVATLLLALIMVAWHVMRTLASNPINSLKYE